MLLGRWAPIDIYIYHTYVLVLGALMLFALQRSATFSGSHHVGGTGAWDTWEACDA